MHDILFNRPPDGTDAGLRVSVHALSEGPVLIASVAEPGSGVEAQVLLSEAEGTALTGAILATFDHPGDVGSEPPC